jgi:ketosteroid isomerase-like protein
MHYQLEIEAVEDANERFYRALEDADLDGMSEVWLHEEWVKCVHPGWDLIIGWEGVRESWARIFSNTSGMRVKATSVEIKIDEDFALVTCHENLALFLDNTSAPVSAQTAATNLFRRIGGQWRMIHHHASQVPKTQDLTESNQIQ